MCPFQETIIDHLHYPAGPRVRDHLSHGEAPWQPFPWQLTRNLATIVVALTTRMLDKEICANVYIPFLLYTSLKHFSN